jgi:hypothetical protein
MWPGPRRAASLTAQVAVQLDQTSLSLSRGLKATRPARGFGKRASRTVLADHGMDRASWLGLDFR